MSLDFGTSELPFFQCYAQLIWRFSRLFSSLQLNWIFLVLGIYQYFFFISGELKCLLLRLNQLHNAIFKCHIMKILYDNLLSRELSAYINNVCLDVISDGKLYCNIYYSSFDVFLKKFLSGSGGQDFPNSKLSLLTISFSAWYFVCPMVAKHFMLLLSDTSEFSHTLNSDQVKLLYF